MQRQNVILIPPSDEQAYPVFHVTKEFAAPLLAYLAAKDIEVRDTPERIGQLGPESKDVVEIELTDDQHSISALEEVVDDFFASRNLSNE